MNSEQIDELHHRNRWGILALVGLAQLMVVLDVTIVNIALPSAQHALGFSNAARQWVITAYSLAFGSLLLLGGRVSDLLGRKFALVVGLIGFGIASAVGGAAQSFAMLIAARVVQGVFGALLAPAALSLLSTIFTDDRERRIGFAVFGGIAGAGGAVGLLLGGLLTQYLSWRYCLYVNTLISVFGVIAAVLLLRNTRANAAARLDLLGTALACSGLFCLVFGLDRAQADGWTATITLGFLVAALVLLAAFVYSQSRVTGPLLPLPVIADRNRGGAYLAVLLVGLGIFGVFLFLTYYLQETLGFSPSRTGVAFLPNVVVLMVTAAISQTQLLPRFGPRPLVFTGLLLGALAMFLLTRLTTGSSYTGSVLVPLLIAGFGVGLTMSTAMGTATRNVPAAVAGAASALVNTAQQIGGSIGVALLSTVAAHSARSYLVAHMSAQATSGAGGQGSTLAARMAAAAAQLEARAQVHSYTVAFAVTAGIMVGGAVICGAILRPGPPPPLQSVPTDPQEYA